MSDKVQSARERESTTFSRVETAGDTSGSWIAGLATNYLTATNSYFGLTGLDVER